tara:strand:+ start:1026 stop:1622 length:597 start_codon:yes stop_codon:yes gene_type:complete
MIDELIDELTTTFSSLNLGFTDRLLIEFGLSRTDLFVILMILVLFALWSISGSISEIRKRQEDSIRRQRLLEELKDLSSNEVLINKYSDDYIYHANKLDKVFSFTHIITVAVGFFILNILYGYLFAWWLPEWLVFILFFIALVLLIALGQGIEDKFDFSGSQNHANSKQRALEKVRELQAKSKPKKTVSRAVKKPKKN